MSNTTIHYSVLAITKNELPGLIKKLKEANLIPLASWLSDNSHIYGNLSEDWKPFNDDTIKQIIENNSKSYTSETHLISNINDEFTNLNVISHIQVFFIDVVSLLLKKYQDLATRLDSIFSNSDQGKSCFIINQTVPLDMQRKLEMVNSNLWPQVLEGYKEGKLHRVAVRIDDLLNFKNYLLSISINMPNSETINLPDSETLEQVKSKMPGDGPLPKLVDQ
ncbi:MAG: hypothetical protein GQ468_03685 [Candidatus Scalindua sp.]|nr:hypothetical protein [Candidatus Scalindua sp.]